MTQIQTRPIKWLAHYLHCDCGERMMFMFQVRKPEGTVYLHTCPKCASTAEEPCEYPTPVWEEA